jgi:uncharacterized repeat protein (TIGR01451 family)
MLAKAPLLFVRLEGLPGQAVTFLGPGAQTDHRNAAPPGLPAHPQGRTLDLPVTVGLRPGFVYRICVHDWPRYPGLKVYASLEVRGTLHLSPGHKASDFPAPLPITEDDADAVAEGNLVTKVIALEDADKTALGPLFGGQPAVLRVGGEEDPLAYARSLGRPLVLVRMGTREPEPAELARLGPGMILFPGMTSLPAPGPHQLFHTMPPEWPVKGPFDPLEEFLHDGGDRGRPAHLEAGRQLQGLDPSDTVAEYRDASGKLKLKPSNVVCLFVPRWLVVRQELVLSRMDAREGIHGVSSGKRQEQLAAPQRSRPLRGLEEPEHLRSRQKPQASLAHVPAGRVDTVEVLQAAVSDRGLAAFLGSDDVRLLRDEDRLRWQRQVLLALELSRDQATAGTQGESTVQAVGHVAGLGKVAASASLREFVCLDQHGQPQLPDRPLHLLKWASTDQAQVGDVVTFYIRYSNLGGKPIRDIAISDSLTGRLEYIPGSARSDREAVFITQQNEAGSLTLRWEIRQPLPPGAKGIVSFQARIR